MEALAQEVPEGNNIRESSGGILASNVTAFRPYWKKQSTRYIEVFWNNVRKGDFKTM